ncbi:cell division protein FtsZ [Natrarchaeobius chitinivorans]|uniref:Tubulin-like protein CetZ n=1 Tax=Natrarchaeobius chitinivorans TaxID=1679083 RepID=A0A3N6M3U9_NATCH|nr:cell division protein FtsZ [Natrarchaeobius chitinivorans]RQG95134.1 cell division protein FtsZ [Natrarchaeobius chitinivorans]
MQLEVIGVGGAGCRIADSILDADPAEHSFVGDAFAFDTDARSLRALSAIPDDHRHRYGGTVENGLNGNLQRGDSVGEESVDELERQLDRGQPSIADAFLIAVGLGGATGGGTVPHLVATLQTMYDAPVYVLATLPAERELEAPESDDGDPRAPNASGSGEGGVDGERVPPAGDGRAETHGIDDERVETNDTGDERVEAAGTVGVGPGESTRPPDDDPTEELEPEPTTRPLAEENATRTLERLEGLANAIVCFDNERWLKSAEGLLEGRDRLNRELAARVAAFFGATADASDGGTGPDAETVIDANDVGRILGDGTDLVTLGYGEQRVEAESGSRFGLGLFATEPSVDTAAAVSAIETTVGKALRGKLTLECDREHADRGMLVVGGPPEWLNRRAITDGRKTIESATGSVEILGGDAPRPGTDLVYAVVVLAGIEPVERLEERRNEA